MIDKVIHQTDVLQIPVKIYDKYRRKVYKF